MLTDYLAIDCERVEGTTRRGRIEMLARVTIINDDADIVLDEFVKPIARVSNYRTSVSGIRRADLINAMDFDEVRLLVCDIIRGRILIGHSIDRDLKVLRLSHPEWNIRDTSKFPLFLKMNRKRTPSLKWLARRVLDWRIQEGEHDSFEDAEAALRIYQQYADEWEDYHDRIY